MSKQDYVEAIIMDSAKVDQPTAQMIVERLKEEGLLHLGYGDPDIDRVILKFQETFGTTKTSKYDRFAARRLVAKYGSQAIVGIIQLLGQNRELKYAPIVGSVSQLEEKIVSVISFLRKGVPDNETLDI